MKAVLQVTDDMGHDTQVRSSLNQTANSFDGNQLNDKGKKLTELDVHEG